MAPRFIINEYIGYNLWMTYETTFSPNCTIIFYFNNMAQSFATSSDNQNNSHLLIWWIYLIIKLAEDWFSYTDCEFVVFSLYNKFHIQYVLHTINAFFVCIPTLCLLIMQYIKRVSMRCNCKMRFGSEIAVRSAPTVIKTSFFFEFFLP